MPEQLPAKISSIQPQKKNKDRYSIFIGDQFLIGVSEETLLQFDLCKGLEMTPLLYRKIQDAEDRGSVRSYCIKMLGRRAHSRKELKRKALKKDFVPEVVEDVLYELEKKGYIDDREFAEKFAADKVRLNKWGPRKIKAALLEKGVDGHTASASIARAFDDIETSNLILNLVLKNKKRFLREADKFKRKKKIFDYLSRKGFSYDVILKQIDNILNAVES